MLAPAGWRSLSEPRPPEGAAEQAELVPDGRARCAASDIGAAVSAVRAARSMAGLFAMNSLFHEFSLYIFSLTSTHSALASCAATPFGSVSKAVLPCAKVSA